MPCCEWVLRAPDHDDAMLASNSVVMSLKSEKNTLSIAITNKTCKAFLHHWKNEILENRKVMKSVCNLLRMSRTEIISASKISLESFRDDLEVVMFAKALEVNASVTELRCARFLTKPS